MSWTFVTIAKKRKSRMRYSFKDKTGNRKTHFGYAWYTKMNKKGKSLVLRR